jgi:hypothetical protein
MLRGWGEDYRIDDEREHQEAEATRRQAERIRDTQETTRWVTEGGLVC